MSTNEFSPRNRAERRLAGKKARTAGAVLTAGSAALAMGAAWVGPGMTAAGAATVRHVTSLNDSGAGTLRDQIAASVDGDTIVFDVTGTITLTTGEIATGDDLTITGPGAANLTISGNSTSRIFDFTGANVTISGLTLTDGVETSASESGGAVRATSSQLVLDGVTITGNSATAGGGGVAATGDGNSLTVLNSLVEGNSTDGNTANDGGGGLHVLGTGAQLNVVNTTVTGNTTEARWAGGIYFYSGDGALTITSSTITDNTSFRGGGGGWLGGHGASTTVTDTQVSGNTSETDNGGGLYFYTDRVDVSGSAFFLNIAGDNGGGALFETNDDGVSITNSSFTENTASFYGGGIALYDETGAVDIRATTISGNDAGSGGGGLYAGADGGSSSGSLHIADSTISGNHSDEWGGGLYISRLVGGAEIVNSTISGNTADSEGGGINFNGYYGLTLVQDTITDNTGNMYGGLYISGGKEASARVKAHSARATDDGDRPGNPTGHADGSRVRGSAVTDVEGETTIIGTIIWGNHGGSETGADVGPSSIIHADHSLFGLVSPDTVIDDQGGNLFGVDPLLGPLANNGGATQTHELLAGSPAIDAGPSPVTISTLFTGDYDQREAPFLRVQFTGIDIGAFEVQAPQPIDIAPKFTG